MNAVITDYRILGYASSVLAVEAMPFLLVVRREEGPVGYLLSNWQTAVKSESELADLYVDDILQTLREQVDGWTEEAEFLFFSLGDLSDGPIRTIVSGSFLSSGTEAQEVPGQAIIECSQERFNSLVSLTEMARVAEFEKDSGDRTRGTSDVE